MVTDQVWKQILLAPIFLWIYWGKYEAIFSTLRKLAGDDRTEDDIAMLRKEREYKNVLLVEQPNTKFCVFYWAPVLI